MTRFDFRVDDTMEGTLTATLEGAALIFTEADLWKTRLVASGTIYFTAHDIDAYFVAA